MLQRLESLELQFDGYPTFNEGIIGFPAVTFGGKSSDEYVNLVKYRQNLIEHHYASLLIQRMSTSERMQMIDLIAFNLRPLGLPNGTPTGEVWPKILELGSEIPMEAAVQTALDIADGKIHIEQHRPLLMVTKPDVSCDGHPRILEISCNNDYPNPRPGFFDLRDFYVSPDWRWGPEVRFLVSPHME